jgi:hypothetical protein
MSAVENILGVWSFEFGVWSLESLRRAFARGFEFGFWGFGLQNPQSEIRDPQSK